MSPQPTPPAVWWSPSAPDWIITDDGATELVHTGTSALGALPADAVQLTDETPAEGLLRYIRADRAACLAHIESITTAHEASLARVTAERDGARAQHAAVLAQRDSWWETVGAQKQALRDEITQLREQRAADLVDLRAAAQDLRALGRCCAAVERTGQVIARIRDRAGETTDA